MQNIIRNVRYKTTAKVLSYNAPFFRQQKVANCYYIRYKCDRAVIMIITYHILQAVLDYFTGCGELMNKPFVQQFSKFLPSLAPQYVAAKCVTASQYMMGGYNPDQIYWVIL